MCKISKTFAFFLTITIAMSCLTILIVKPANAQSIPKPSVPEFTVKYVDRTYYVPPVYGIDQYSGKTVQTGGGFTVTNKTLEVTIMGQSFTPYVFTGDDGLPHEPSMMWDMAYKGHFGEDWTIVSQGPAWNESSKVVVFGLGTENQNSPMYIPAGLGDQVDFKVRARIGYSTLAQGHSFTDPDAFIFHGETSDWSNIQTITIRETTGSYTPNPTSPTTSTPTSTPSSTPIATDTNTTISSINLPLNTFVVIVGALALTMVVLSMLLLRRHRTTTKLNTKTLYRRLREIPWWYKRSFRITNGFRIGELST